jgi:tripartite-type tricarboxylate transporter receptor subunit TctC
MKKLIYFLLAILMTFGVAIVGPTAAMASNPFFEGKTVNIVVPFGAGSGLDVWARVLAQFLGKHIQGNPNVLVVNQPGAGGGKAFTIFYERAKPDGLTIVTGTPGTHARWLTKTPGHTTYDLNKMGLFVICPSGTVHIVSTQLGVRSVEELKSLDRTIRSGFTDVGSTIAIADRMAADLFGYSVKQVSGYKGYNETALGMLRGELDMSGHNANGYNSLVVPIVKKGEVIVLFQSGIFDATGNIIRDPRIPDVPTIEEIYKKIYGKDPKGRAWDGIKAVVSAQTVGFALWLPPGVPQERTQVLIHAFKSMVNSAEFKVEAEKILGGEPVFLIGKESQLAFRTLIDAPPEIVELFKTRRK